MHVESPELPPTLPDGWAMCKTGDVARVVGGGTPKVKDDANFDPAGHAWLTPKDLSGHEDMYISRGARGLSDSGLGSSSATLMPPETVLFTSRAPIGYVAIAANPIATNQGFRSFICGPAIRPTYLYWYLKWATPLAESLASGTTFPEISGTNAARIPLALPPLVEQDRIAAKLAEMVPRVRQLHRRLRSCQEQLEHFRRAVRRFAISGQLTPAWRDQRDEVQEVDLEQLAAQRAELWAEHAGGSRRHTPSEPALDGSEEELPQGWSWVCVDQVAVVRSGNTPKGIDSRLQEAGEIPWFKVGDMNTAGNETELKIPRSWLSVKDIEETGMPVLPAGSIVFPKRGGAIATNKKRRLAKPSAVDLNTMVMIPNPVVSEYLGEWFETVDLGSLSDGSNVPQINHPDIQRLPLPLPPVDEQRAICRRIAEALERSEPIHDRIGRVLGPVAALEKAILSKAFQGELVPPEADIARSEGPDFQC